MRNKISNSCPQKFLKAYDETRTRKSPAWKAGMLANYTTYADVSKAHLQ